VTRTRRVSVQSPPWRRWPERDCSRVASDGRVLVRWL
jgi:hypothetical protein